MCSSDLVCAFLCDTEISFLCSLCISVYVCAFLCSSLCSLCACRNARTHVCLTHNMCKYKDIHKCTHTVNREMHRHFSVQRNARTHVCLCISRAFLSLSSKESNTHTHTCMSVQTEMHAHMYVCAFLCSLCVRAFLSLSFFVCTPLCLSLYSMCLYLSVSVFLCLSAHETKEMFL